MFSVCSQQPCGDNSAGKQGYTLTILNEAPTVVTVFVIFSSSYHLENGSFVLSPDPDLLQDLSQGSIGPKKLTALVAEQRKAIDHALMCECVSTCCHVDTPANAVYQLSLQRAASVYRSDTIKLILP